MSVLLIQLAGPLQSWGASSRFARRATEPAPTKSGVIGLLAAALGRDRTDDITDLAALRFGVRIDQPGTPVRDYQVATHFETGTSMPVSERFYLADAVFLAAVGGDAHLIEELAAALRAPCFLPYLGRRSCPPGRPLSPEVRPDISVEQALREADWRASAWYRRRWRDAHAELEILVEAAEEDGPVDTLRDQPVSFDPDHRRYALRGVRTHRVRTPNTDARRTDHDPTSVLGGNRCI